MSLKKVLVAVVLVGLAGGVIALLSWDIPAPSTKVTKTLSNDRFPG